MRLFAAVVPPPDVLRHLEAAVEPLRDTAVRWAKADGRHVTLAFYGEVPDDRVEELSLRLRRAAGRQPPVELGFAGAGRFDGRVLWVGCTGELDRLNKLAQSCRAAGRRVGADVETHRRYRAHVTLARSSRPVDLRPYVAALSGYAGPLWTATEIALVGSHLGAGEGGRPRYEQVAAFELAG